MYLFSIDKNINIIPLIQANMINLLYSIITINQQISDLHEEENEKANEDSDNHAPGRTLERK